MFGWCFDIVCLDLDALDKLYNFLNHYVLDANEWMLWFWWCVTVKSGVNTGYGARLYKWFLSN